jgi:hypothetical protein
MKAELFQNGESFKMGNTQNFPSDPRERGFALAMTGFDVGCDGTLQLISRCRPIFYDLRPIR